MATKGIIMWRGDMGNPTTHYSKSTFPDVTAVAAVDTLGTALAAFSDANVAKVSFIESDAVTDAAPGAVPAANVDEKAICYFRDTTTLKVHSCTIPAVKSTAVEETPEGDRVTAAAMTTIVAAIATATGATLVPLYGVVIKKR